MFINLVNGVVYLHVEEYHTGMRGCGDAQDDGVTGHKALAVLRSFTADMREWGVTVSSEEKLMVLAREYFADGLNTLDGRFLYIAWLSLL
ncbi:TPA: hypothetical protein ACWV7H_004941 [Salmonella enterica subsp. enterica serovar Muenchen]